MEDTLIWVDLEDREVGYGEKLKTHQERRLHRAFSVFLVYEGRMLIQKRAKDKYHSGGLWANACCSHPRKGESTEEAVQKRMEFELGISRGSCIPDELFSFVYYAPFQELSEYEFDHVFLADYGGKINCNPEEIDQYQWIEISELEKALLESPEIFCSWFLIAAPRVINFLKKTRPFYFNEGLVSKGQEMISYLSGYIERHFEADLSLDVLAQKVSVSKYHLSREFKKYMGVPPIKYLIAVRLEKAKELLRETEMTITEISEKVGFSDFNNFTNHFKKNVGMTPRSYRSNYYKK